MENGVRRWLVNIRDWNPSEDEFSCLISLLPPHEHSHITRFIKSDDRKRALVSRLLQYSLVHEVLGIPFDKIVIHRTIEGKPFLQNEKSLMFPNFNFNASHHGDYVGIASEPVCLVGLDIMSISIPEKETAVEFIRIFSPYFTDIEWKDIMGAGDLDEILTTFYRYNIEITDTIWREILKHWASVARKQPKEAPERYKGTSDTTGFSLRTIEQIIPSQFERASCVPVK